MSYEGHEEQLNEFDIRWCLVGCFLTDSRIDFQAMQHKMASLWKPGRGMYVKQLDANRFIFQFYHELDIKRVTEGSPWTFGRFQLVFKRLQEGDNPRIVEINNMDIWVQLHGMHTGFMIQRVVADIGNYIGRFIESDPNNFAGVWREFLRVTVTIALDVPLKRRMKLRKNDANWCWVNFKYEVVPTFCFICGMIGYAEKFCENLFDTPAEMIERPYGSWMRAEPRRRMHTIGAKWLKSGGVSRVTGKEMDDDRNGSSSVAGNFSNSSGHGEKSGITVNNEGEDNRRFVSENNGNFNSKKSRCANWLTD